MLQFNLNERYSNYDLLRICILLQFCINAISTNLLIKQLCNQFFVLYKNFKNKFKFNSYIDKFVDSGLND